jgi:membrane protein insertase Oxa1/YidC/SpoIIIJ
MQPSFWQQPIVVASYRAVIGASVMAGAAFFSTLQTGASTKIAGVAAGVAFFGYLALRAGVEGLIDQTTKAA